MGTWKFPKDWGKLEPWQKEVYCKMFSVDIEGNKIPIVKIPGSVKITHELIVRRIVIFRKYGIWVDFNDLDKYPLD